MDTAKEKSAAKKQLNPVPMEAISSNYLFRKQAGLNEFPPRTLPREEVEKKFRLLLADSQWNTAFGSVVKSLRHIVIDHWNVFYVSNKAHAYRDNCKTLEVDDDILRYLFEELAVNFKSLKITETNVETATGKKLLSTAAILDAGIDGLSELTFGCSSYDQGYERFLIGAGAIIRRNAPTLRTLKCRAFGATFAKLLPPETKLEKFEADVSGVDNKWTLADVATVLGANAVRIDINLSSACSSLEYSVVETFSCRHLTVNWSLPDNCELVCLGNRDFDLVEDTAKQVVSMMECIGASARDLESFEMTLTGGTVEMEGKEFFEFADKIIKALASGIDKLAFPWPSTFCATFQMRYLENEAFLDGIEFARLFSTAYPPLEVDENWDEHGIFHIPSWSTERSVKVLTPMSTLRVVVETHAIDNYRSMHK